MQWNRLYLKNRIKSSMLQARGVEDGLLPDALIDEAINEAIMIIADDCHLNWMRERIALVEAEYEYALPEDVLSIRRVWYIDSNGNRNPLVYLSPEKLMDGIDPSETGSEPDFFSYPHYRGKVLEWYGASDFVSAGAITTASSTILIDSVANFGRLLGEGVIKPDDKISNTTDDSYGYVYVLDLTTSIATSTATGDTGSNKLYDTTKDFVTLGCAEFNVICKLLGATVVGYAIVEEVGTTYLVYRDYQDPAGLVTGFASGDSYKVGIADRIPLRSDLPHPYLRYGSDNGFAVDDAYKIQSQFNTQPVMWLNPAPDASDTTGEESIELLYNRMPKLPEQDSDPIVVPQRLSVPLLACARWQAYLLRGDSNEANVEFMKQRYEEAVKSFMGDSWRSPRSAPLTLYGNRYGSSGRRRKYGVSSGATFDAGAYEL